MEIRTLTKEQISNCLDLLNQMYNGNITYNNFSPLNKRGDACECKSNEWSKNWGFGKPKKLEWRAHYLYPEDNIVF